MPKKHLKSQRVSETLACNSGHKNKATDFAISVTESDDKWVNAKLDSTPNVNNAHSPVQLVISTGIRQSFKLCK